MKLNMTTEQFYRHALGKINNLAEIANKFETCFNEIGDMHRDNQELVKTLPKNQAEELDDLLESIFDKIEDMC